jgi:hypothetical protein
MLSDSDVRCSICLGLVYLHEVCTLSQNLFVQINASANIQMTWMQLNCSMSSQWGLQLSELHISRSVFPFCGSSYLNQLRPILSPKICSRNVKNPMPKTRSRNSYPGERVAAELFHFIFAMLTLGIRTRSIEQSISQFPTQQVTHEYNAN